MKNLYCGLDIHKDTITGCIMDKEGNILRHHQFPTQTESITAFLANISNADMEIALEACGLWRGIYTILHTQGYTTHLANPRKIHDIAGKKKTDKEDAKILADLLRTGYLPTVHIPPEHILKLRDITRHKATLTRLRATIQIKIKSYLRREGTPYHRNIWKKDTLNQIAHTDHNLTNLINIYKQFKKEENEVMGRIRKYSTTLKTPSLLKTIPGIGDYSSLLIHAEIGDIKRFPTPKQLISYAGLCPGIYQSGNKERTTKGHAVNKWLKWILYECSGRALMLDPGMQDYYYRVKHRKGHQTARRATARKLLTIIWHILTKEQPYNGPSVDKRARAPPDFTWP